MALFPPLFQAGLDTLEQVGEQQVAGALDHNGDRSLGLELKVARVAVWLIALLRHHRQHALAGALAYVRMPVEHARNGAHTIPGQARDVSNVHIQSPRAR